MSCLDDRSLTLNLLESKNVTSFFLNEQMHEGKGVKFYFDTSVKEFKGEDGKLTEAVLADGTVLPADVCVMGVGKVSQFPLTDSS